MFNPDALRGIIRRKQPGKTYEETARALRPSASGSEDTFGELTLDDMCHISTFEEERELIFMNSDRLAVLRKCDNMGAYSSLEEALPGGCDQWKFVDCHIDPDRAALVLQFLPVCDELSREAGESLTALNEAWRESEELDPEDFTQHDEEEIDVQVLLGKYAIQIVLTGKYEIFLASPEDGGTGEYVQRGISKKTGKMSLKFVELSDDIKINAYVLTKHTLYYL